MPERITKVLSVCFALLWAVIIFIEYWHYNPYYGDALQYFQYAGLLTWFIVLGAGISWGLHLLRQKKQEIKFINGLSVFGAMLLLDIFTISSFYGKINSIELDGLGLFAHLGHFIGVAFCVFLIYLVCRVIGNLLFAIFPIRIARMDLPIVEVGLGLIVLTFLLFVLGLFQLLHLLVVAGLLLLILALNWRKSLEIIKSSLLKPISIPGKLNAIGVFSFLFLGAFLVFDFAQLLRPFPLGTDSINLYVNLPSLIADYSGLVEGHQPYNWSLFMSLGLVAFGRLDVVLALSFFGGFMSLLALFSLSRKWLDVNYSALCLLLFFSVPMINFLAHMDMKIDLGLLYMTLCILLLFVNWVAPPDLSKTKIKQVKTAPSKSKKTTKPKQTKKVSTKNPVWLDKTKTFFSNRIPQSLKEQRLMVLMGLFAGFCFGIKLTALFIFFALMAAIWYQEAKMWGFMAAFFLVLGFTFLLRLDEQALLRQLHGNVALLQYLLLAIGLGMAIYLGIKQRTIFLRLLRISLIVSGFFILPILPWIGKNWMETKSVSVDHLLNGKKAAPDMNLNEMEKRWKEAYEKNEN